MEIPPLSMSLSLSLPEPRLQGANSIQDYCVYLHTEPMCCTPVLDMDHWLSPSGKKDFIFKRRSWQGPAEFQVHRKGYTMSEEALSNEIITYESSMQPLIVTNDLMLKMIRETGAKHFITSQKLDCLAQHPKKILNQNETSRWGKNQK